MNLKNGAHNKANNDKKNYRKLSLAALAICLFLSAGLVATSVYRKADLKKTKELRQLYDAGAAGMNQEGEAQRMEPHTLQKRFEPLLEINGDTVGWIKAGELADEPVVYRDNAYYLNHDFHQRKNSGGTAFLDEENADWERDKYLIVYGHYLKNGGKFGKLEKYRNIRDIKDNFIVSWDSVYSKEPEPYAVFSVFGASMLETDPNYFYLRRFEDLKRKGGMEKLIEESKKRSLFDIPVDVTAKDKIMVLVTCSYENEDGRLLVFCRKIRPNEDIRRLENTVTEKTEEIPSMK